MRSSPFKAKSSAAIKAAQQFSQRKIFVVEKTTAVLKCNSQTHSHTFESRVA
jgi:hypothetical protein